MTLKQLFSLGHLNLYYMKDGDNIKFLDSELLAKLWDKEIANFEPIKVHEDLDGKNPIETRLNGLAAIKVTFA